MPKLLVFILFHSLVYVHGQGLAEHLGVEAQQCEVYHGTMDEYYDMQVMICGDRGAYKMKSSHHIYDLEVERSGDQLEWSEWHNGEDLVAFFLLNKNSNGWEGKWENASSRTSYEVLLQKEKKRKKVIPYITRYESTIDGKDYLIDVNHVDAEIAIIEKYNSTHKIVAPYTCLDKDCNKLVANIEEWNIQKLELQTTGKKQKLTTYKSGKKDKSENAALVYDIARGTLAFSDFRSMIYAEYPVLQIKSFDSQIKSKMAKWVQATSKGIKTQYKNNPEQSASDRLSIRANTWVDIWHWGERMISGVIYEQHSWDGAVTSMPFHYDIENNQWLELSNEVSELKNIVACADGIFTTQFDRINGVVKERMSSAEARTAINEKSWLGKFINQKIVKL